MPLVGSQNSWQSNQWAKCRLQLTDFSIRSTLNLTLPSGVIWKVFMPAWQWPSCRPLLELIPTFLPIYSVVVEFSMPSWAWDLSWDSWQPLITERTARPELGFFWPLLSSLVWELDHFWIWLSESILQSSQTPSWCQEWFLLVFLELPFLPLMVNTCTLVEHCWVDYPPCFGLDF